jgi:Holliday junction resolvasome RuvABC endonuclease subunit
MNDLPHILGLDASSTTLGYVLYAGQLLACGEYKLAGTIEQRCAAAYGALWQLLHDWPAIDAIAIEAPVARYASAVIAQSRVAGALLTLAAQRHILVCEVSPTAAKFALAGRGNVGKETMQARASAYGVSGEHAADALGVVLASLKRIQVVA